MDKVPVHLLFLRTQRFGTACSLSIPNLNNVKRALLKQEFTFRRFTSITYGQNHDVHITNIYNVLFQIELLNPASSAGRGLMRC